eukprot:654453-Pelagomonas_calceolata.AAC.2
MCVSVGLYCKESGLQCYGTAGQGQLGVCCVRLRTCLWRLALSGGDLGGDVLGLLARDDSWLLAMLPPNSAVVKDGQDWSWPPVTSCWMTHIANSRVDAKAGTECMSPAFTRSFQHSRAASSVYMQHPAFTCSNQLSCWANNVQHPDGSALSAQHPVYIIGPNAWKIPPHLQVAVIWLDASIWRSGPRAANKAVAAAALAALAAASSAPAPLPFKLVACDFDVRAGASFPDFPLQRQDVTSGKMVSIGVVSKT